MEKRRHRPKRHRQRGGVTRVAAQKKLRHHHGGQKVDAAAAIAVDDIESNRSIGRVPRRVSSSGSRRLEQGATNRRVAPKRNWRMKRGRNREREREKSVDKEKRDVEGSRGVPLVLARFYWKTSATAALSAHLFFFPATFVEPPTILLPSRLCLRASVSSTSNSSGRTTSSPGFFSPSSALESVLEHPKVSTTDAHCFARRLVFSPLYKNGIETRNETRKKQHTAVVLFSFFSNRPDVRRRRRMMAPKPGPERPGRGGGTVVTCPTSAAHRWTEGDNGRAGGRPRSQSPISGCAGQSAATQSGHPISWNARSPVTGTTTADADAADRRIPRHQIRPTDRMKCADIVLVPNRFRKDGLLRRLDGWNRTTSTTSLVTERLQAPWDFRADETKKIRNSPPD